MTINAEENSQPVLLTGASGFIGSHLGQELLDQDAAVRAIVRSPIQIGDDLKSSGRSMQTVQGDLTDPATLEKACTSIDTVFHLAGIAHVGTSDNSLSRLVNVNGTENLVRACKKAGVRRLVFFSSILAQQSRAEVDQETTDDTYAKSKRDAEAIVLDATSDSFQTVILRPVNVYGPCMRGNIAAMIRRINSGRLPPLPKLNHALPLVGVKDLCRAAILAANTEAATGQIYTVTDDISYTPNSIEEAIYKALGRKKPGWRTPRMVFYAASLGAQIANNLGVWKNDIGLRTYRNLIGEGASQTVSCDKITTELGYQPSQTFYDVLPDIIEHMGLD